MMEGVTHVRGMGDISPHATQLTKTGFGAEGAGAGVGGYQGAEGVITGPDEHFAGIGRSVKPIPVMP